MRRQVAVAQVPAGIAEAGCSRINAALSEDRAQISDKFFACISHFPVLPFVHGHPHATRARAEVGALALVVRVIVLLPVKLSVLVFATLVNLPFVCGGYLQWA